MRILVTGGNGFIGSRVVRALDQAGHDVVCLLRPTSRTDRLEGVRYRGAVGDVRDAESVRAALGSCDATLHLAAPGGWEADDRTLLAEVIEGGTRNVLAAAAAASGHRVVVVSSTAAIDASDEPRVFDEQSAFTITDHSLVYAHAKHRMEGIVHEAVARGVDAVIVNPAEVYGPGDDALVTAGNLLDFATSWPVLIARGGTSVVHVEDVAHGIIAALHAGRAGERYILGGENLSIRELAELVLELQGRRVPVLSVPRTLARALARLALRTGIPLPFNVHVVPYATRYWFVDNGKARRELGVEFRSARVTIGETLEWLRSTGRLGRA